MVEKIGIIYLSTSLSVLR